MDNTAINDSPFPLSPVVPTLYDDTKLIQFRCHKEIACFNACCKNIDISLTPYDILRLKRRLGMNSGDFLRQYTHPYEMEQDGIAGVKFKPVEESTACQFVTDAGCSVYEDRPTACRYYPVALISMRKQNEYTDSDSYALVKEAHCMGHNEDRSLTIAEYRMEQGLADYDTLARGWRQLVLKKKSSGPSVGKASKRSLQMFFMACYDLDRFREFVSSGPFNETYDLSEELKQQIFSDESELMQFGFRFLRQVMFGEESIPVHTDALEKRTVRQRELAEALAVANSHAEK